PRAGALVGFGTWPAIPGHTPPSFSLLPGGGLLPLAVRRLSPVEVLAVVTAVTAFAAVAYQDSWWPFAAIIAFYSVAAHSPRRRAMIAGGVALGVLALGAAASINWQGLSGVPRLAGDLAPLAAAWFLGDSLRNRRAHLRGVGGRLRQLQREAEANTPPAAADAPAPIARRRHDLPAPNPP